MKRVLVTAALGNVGREVVAACLARGFRVRAAERDVEAARRRFPEAEAVRFDFRDRATWSAALAGCDFVFLLRPPPISEMDETLNPFVDAACASGVEQVVFLSVSGADRMKWIPHGKVERHLQARAGWTVLRAGFFAQNLEDAYRRDLVEDDRLFVPAAEGRVAFVDVRDVAEVAAQVFASPAAFDRKVLTLTGPEAVTLSTVAALLSRQLGRRITYQPASISAYVWHLWHRRGLAPMQVAVQTFLHWGLRRGDAAQVEPTVQQVLGRPAGKLEAYVARSADLWRTRKEERAEGSRQHDWRRV